MSFSLFTRPVAPLLATIALTSFALLSAHPAQAQFVTYTGTDIGAGPGSPRPQSNAAAAAFDTAAAAIGPRTLVTFESAPLGAFSNLAIAPGVTINSSNSLLPTTIRNSPNFPANPALGGFNTTTGGSNYIDVQAGTVTFTFSQPVQYFGAYFTGIQTVFFNSVITFNDGTSRTIMIPGGSTNSDGGVTFAGFTDLGASISSIAVTSGTPSGGDFIGIDDVRFGPAVVTTVPEPGEWATIGMATAGLSGLMVRARRRKVTTSATLAA